MALSLDKFVLIDASARAHVNLSLEFVGYFNNWTTNDIFDCQTSSRSSECLVNAYHLCGNAVGAGVDPWAFWRYSKCMFGRQYPPLDRPDALYAECASPFNVFVNDSSRTCTLAQFPAVMANISGDCATEAGLAADAVRGCVDDGHGAALLKTSFAKTLTFPRNPKGYIEPQWIEVDGAPCSDGWEGCQTAFDKTSCEDWDHCDHDAWAQHILRTLCDRFGSDIVSCQKW